MARTKHDEAICMMRELPVTPKRDHSVFDVMSAKPYASMSYAIKPAPVRGKLGIDESVFSIFGGEDKEGTEAPEEIMDNINLSTRSRRLDPPKCVSTPCTSWEGNQPQPRVSVPNHFREHLTMHG